MSPSKLVCRVGYLKCHMAFELSYLRRCLRGKYMCVQYVYIYIYIYVYYISSPAALSTRPRLLLLLIIIMIITIMILIIQLMILQTTIILQLVIHDNHNNDNTHNNDNSNTSSLVWYPRQVVNRMSSLISGTSRMRFIHSSNQIPCSSNVSCIVCSDSSNRGMSKQYPLIVVLEPPIV